MSDREEKSEQELNLDLETFKIKLELAAGLIEEGFLESGTRFGLGEFAGSPSMDVFSPQVDSVDAWVIVGEKERKGFLRNVIIELGLVPDQLTRERATRTYEEEGVKGQTSEGGAEVMVFPAKFPGLELHVLDYRNKDVGRRYDLVVAE